MRILVTGGTGYLGGAIVSALIARGHDVTIFARHAASSALEVRTVAGDVRDADAVSAAARGADALCHTAALVSVWRKRRADFDEINVGGLRSAIEACQAAGAAKLVYTSSFLALPPAGARAPLQANDYQRTKAAAWRLAQAAAARGVPIVTTYPGVIYGPGAMTEGNLIGRLVRDHLERRLPGLIGAERPWSYAYVDDVAAGHVAALERGRPGTDYVLGGENAPQMRIFEIVRALTGAPLPRRIPFGLAAAAGLVEELRAHLTGRPPLLTRAVVEIFRHDWSLDSTRSIRQLGYHVTPLEDGIRRTVASLMR